MEIRKNETQLVCIAKFIAKEGEVEALIHDLHALIALTHQEGGCIRYELNQCIDDPNRITFIEKWYDETTFNTHCAMPYITKFFNDGKPLHVKEFEVNLHKQILA
ncbi:putative quinol monooxygenase [Ancylomarina longa]|uniref:Antibiotic biosynthesis monooxygenase n=1 Tax=Ancylomarina longa TaxID=2487017 RepID=A0A434AX52_9BACT|nr:putative quinol monooxygenase [Ancylomarina longa]RUT79083.1 antibiotic biosynthesis monooxygenase [Ancylomarina longa]